MDKQSMGTSSASLLDETEILSNDITEQWMVLRGEFDYNMIDYMRLYHTDAYICWVVVNRWIERNYENNVIDDNELSDAEFELELLMIEFWRDYSNYDAHRE